MCGMCAMYPTWSGPGIGVLYRAFCGIPGTLGGARSIKVMEGLLVEERWGRLY